MCYVIIYDNPLCIAYYTPNTYTPTVLRPVLQMLFLAVFPLGANVKLELSLIFSVSLRRCIHCIYVSIESQIRLRIEYLNDLSLDSFLCKTCHSHTTYTIKCFQIFFPFFLFFSEKRMKSKKSMQSMQKETNVYIF